MEKTKLALVGLCASMFALSACVNEAIDDEGTTAAKNAYTVSWINTFGLIDQDQDWVTVSSVKAQMQTGGQVSEVHLYSAAPQQGGRKIASTKSGGTYKIDVNEGAEWVYGCRYDQSGNVLDQGYYHIANGMVSIDGSGLASKPAKSRDGEDAADTSYFDATVMCEDLGNIGDYDFNDIVLGLKHVGGDTPTLTIVPLAAGGTLAAEILFKGQAIGEMHSLIKPGSPTTTMLNTSAGTTINYQKLTHIQIDLKGIGLDDWTIADNLSDIKIAVISKDKTEIVAAPTDGTAPQMICLGGDWPWPLETQSINKAFNGFAAWSMDHTVYDLEVKPKYVVKVENIPTPSVDDTEDNSGDTPGETPQLEQINGVAHMSIDDVYSALTLLKTSNAASVWDIEFYGWLKKLHERYGMVVSLYCLNCDTMDEVKDTWKDELAAASSWLKFGFHSWTHGTPIVNDATAAEHWKSVAANVERFASIDNLDRAPRLDYYAGSKTALTAMRDAKHGAVGFLTSDDSRDSYFLSAEQNATIKTSNSLKDTETGLTFFHTDYRLDWLTSGWTPSGYTPYWTPLKSTAYDDFTVMSSTEGYKDTFGVFIVFVHEGAICIGGDERARVESACKWIQGSGMTWDFPQNLIK